MSTLMLAQTGAAQNGFINGFIGVAQAMQNSVIMSSTTSTPIASSTTTSYFAAQTGSFCIPGIQNIQLKRVDSDGNMPLTEGRFKLPDGTIIEIDAKGNSKIIDAKKRVTYRASPNLEFNPFINASDLLAEFIRDLGGLGVPNDKIMRVPLDFYIHWLVVRAALADGDVVQDHKCLTCGRFLHKDKWKVGACSGDHLLKFEKKAKAA
jgi:hypothetical protein